MFIQNTNREARKVIKLHQVSAIFLILERNLAEEQLVDRNIHKRVLNIIAKTRIDKSSSGLLTYKLKDVSFIEKPESLKRHYVLKSPSFMNS